MIKNIPTSKEPQKFAVMFANIIFILGILFSFLIAILSLYKMYTAVLHITNTFYLIFFLFGVISAILFGLGLRLSNDLKINLSLPLIIVVISVYAMESYLYLKSYVFYSQKLRESVLTKAEEMGISYDMRTRVEVLNDLNNSGVEAYPNIFPELFIHSNGLLSSNNEKIFPLGGISNITTLFDNESGFYPIIETDEYGFNNPKGLYKKNKVDIMLTGDSYTEGYSVNFDESVGAVLRELGFNSINVGKGANASLAEFAILKEYAEPIQPRVVLWLYFINDINELNNEMNSPFLRQYLEKNDFTQNLISRQDEIDSLLIDYASKLLAIRFMEEDNEELLNSGNIKEFEKLKEELGRLKEEERIIERERKINIAFHILQLTTLRSKILNLKPQLSSEPDLIVFKKILEKSKKLVSGWGGKLYLVYLPYFDRYSTGNEHPFRNNVLNAATELGIPIIDMHKEVFESHPDPLSLFPFRMPSHYNAKGFRLLAEAINKRLRDDGMIPLKSIN